MRTLLVPVADSSESRIMFTWLVENEIKPGDHLHILHVTVIDPSNAALPGGDYFLQVTSHSSGWGGGRARRGRYNYLSSQQIAKQHTTSHLGRFATYVQAISPVHSVVRAPLVTITTQLESAGPRLVTTHPACVPLVLTRSTSVC